MTDENLYAPPEADVETPDRHPDELATRVSRLGASIIDTIAISLIFWPLIVAFGFWEKMSAGRSTQIDSMVILIIGMGVFLLLQGYLLATRGQSIGKVIVGIRIVSVANGKILSLPRLFLLRYVPFYIGGILPGVGPFVGLINVLFIFRQDRRCLHDHVAGTKVVVA